MQHWPFPAVPALFALYSESPAGTSGCHKAHKMSQINAQRPMFVKSSTFPRSNVSAPFRRDLLPVSSETSEAGPKNHILLCVQSGSLSAQKRCITVKTHPYLLPQASIKYIQLQGGSLHAPQDCPDLWRTDPCLKRICPLELLSYPACSVVLVK